MLQMQVAVPSRYASRPEPALARWAARPPRADSSDSLACFRSHSRPARNAARYLRFFCWYSRSITSGAATPVEMNSSRASSISRTPMSPLRHATTVAHTVGAPRCRLLSPLGARQDERADRAAVTLPKAYVAMLVPTGLHLLSVEQITGGDVEPARNGLD